MINQDFIQDLNDGSIVDVMDALGVKSKGGGENVRIQCISPQHEDRDPSMSVNKSTGEFNCFSCGCKGCGPISFVAAYKNIDTSRNFVDAVKETAQLVGRPVVFDDDNSQRASQREAINYVEKCLSELPPPDEEKLRRFVESRKITAADAKSFGLSYAPKGFGVKFDRKYWETLTEMGLFRQVEGKNFGFFTLNERILFPIRSHSGSLIAYGGRKLADEDYGPKYRNTENTELFNKSKVLYGLDNALKSADGGRVKGLTVVEGYMDVIASHRVGATSVVAPLGTAVTQDHIKLMRRYTDTVTFLFDPDNAGLQAAARALVECAPFIETMRFRFGFLPHDNDEKADPELLIRTGRTDVLAGAIKNAKRFPEMAADYVLEGGVADMEDLVGKPAERARMLYQAMPPCLSREVFSQQLAARLSAELGITINPEVMGLRISQEADAMNNVEAPRMEHAASNTEVMGAFNAGGKKAKGPGNTESASRTPDTKAPEKVQALTPVSAQAKWITLPVQGRPSEMQVLQVLQHSIDGISAVNINTGESFDHVRPEDALQIDVTRHMVAHKATPALGIAEGDTIHLIGKKWLKTFPAEALEVVPQPAAVSKPAAVKSESDKATPRTATEKKPELTQPVWALTPASIEAEWVAAPSAEGNTLDILKVSGHVGDVLETTNQRTGATTTYNRSDVLEIAVERQIKAKTANATKGIAVGDPIYLIGGQWRNSIQPVEFSVTADAATFKREGEAKTPKNTTARPKPGGVEETPIEAKILHRKAAASDWVLSPVNAGGYLIGQVKYASSSNQDMLVVEMLNGDPSGNYFPATSVKPVQVDKVMASQRDNPAIGVKAGEKIVKIAGKWHGPRIPPAKIEHAAQREVENSSSPSP